MLVLPNKDGVAVVCCVDAPLENTISFVTNDGSSILTTTTASPAERHQRALLMMALLLRSAAVSVY